MMLSPYSGSLSTHTYTLAKEVTNCQVAYFYIYQMCVAKLAFIWSHVSGLMIHLSVLSF